MVIDDKFRVEKLQDDISRETLKVLSLSSGTIDKYGYLTDEEMLPSDQRIVIEQPKFTSSSLQKALENKRKQLKLKEKNNCKQLKSIKNNWLNLTLSF